MRNEMNNQEKTLEEKLRELSMDDLNKITYQKIVLSHTHKGKVISDGTKAMLSAACKGRVLSDEHKAKLFAANKGKQRGLGYKHTDEDKAKISAGNTGKIRSAETKAKTSATLTGRVRSDETKAKISAGLKASLSTSKISKVTEAQVLEIRSKYIPHKYTSVKLGKEYGLEARTIMRIIKRITWKHI